MENRVGENTPSTTEVQKMVQQLQELTTKLRSFCTSLSPEERKGLTRARLGSEEHVYQMAELAKKHTLSIAGITPDMVLNDLRTDRDLAPLEHALQVALDLVQDTRSQARSEYSDGGYLFYGMLQQAAERIAELQPQIKSFAEFLANRRRKPSPTPPG